MSITSTPSSDGKTVKIAIGGKCDFNLHRQFRDAYESHKLPGTGFVVDLASTEFMDSSALGMLLLLREYAGGDAASVTLINCGPGIFKILKIVNFQRLFTVEGW